MYMCIHIVSYMLSGFHGSVLFVICNRMCAYWRETVSNDIIILTAGALGGKGRESIEYTH